MNLTKEARKKKLIAYAEKFPINDLPGISSILSPDNTYFHSSKGLIETIGCKNEEEAHDIPFREIPSEGHKCYKQWEIDNQFGIETKKLVRIITYGNFSDGWKVYLGHQKPIIDKESNEVIGTLANYLDITENSIFDVGRLLLMEQGELKRKQFSYRIQESKGFEGLTKREQEVLFWYNHGVNSIGISRRLSKPDRPIMPSTIRSYLEKIKLKLGVTTKEQLLEKSISIGFMCTVPESLFID